MTNRKCLLDTENMFNGFLACFSISDKRDIIVDHINKREKHLVLTSDKKHCFLFSGNLQGVVVERVVI